MERETGLRSWFHRAIQISPSLRQLENEEDDNDDVHDVDVGAEHNIMGTDGVRPKTLSIPGLNSKDFNQWCLLQKDNARFWDCLVMLRSDPSLTCHSAIYLVTQSPDSEYFPDGIRSSGSRFFSNSIALTVEILRLTVENRKLHAVLWVLSDNPHFRVDSVLAAIFRLNDTQFDDKFHFDYVPGCFSGKTPVLLPGNRGGMSGSNVAMHNKRCRSSTPVRTYRPLRHVSERMCHSMTRSSKSRKAVNTSSNKKCSVKKYGAPRKRRSDWMGSSLFTGVGHKSSKNPMLNSDDEDDDKAAGCSAGMVRSKDCSKESKNTGYSKPRASSLHSGLSRSTHRCHKDQPKQCSAGNCAEEHKPRRNSDKESHKHRSYNSNDDDKKVKSRSNANNSNDNDNNANVNTIFDYIDKEASSAHDIHSKSHTPDQYNVTAKGVSTATKNTATQSNAKLPKTTNSLVFNTDSLNMHQFKTKPSKQNLSVKNSVQFQNFPSIASNKVSPTISYSDTPRPSMVLSTPYSLVGYDKPADFIHRHARLERVMAGKRQRKIDIKFYPNQKCDQVEVTTKTFVFQNVKDQKPSSVSPKPTSKSEKKEKSNSIMNAIKICKKKAISKRNDYKAPESDKRINTKDTNKYLTEVVESNAVAQVDMDKIFEKANAPRAVPVDIMKEIIVEDNNTEILVDKSETHQYGSSVQERLKGCDCESLNDQCVRLKKPLLKMGRRQYTKPLLDMINNTSSCSGKL